jgi:hypothetical protein
LFTKAKQIHEKYGPFDVHLCIGDFFAPDTENEAIEDLINGNIEGKWAIDQFIILHCF